MNRPDDQALKALLARRDPATGHPVEPVTSPSARALLERVMSTPVTDQSAPTRPAARGTRRRSTLLAAAGLVVAGGVGYGLVSGPFAVTTATPAPSATASARPTVAGGATLSLSVPGGGGVADSCAMFEPAVLAGAPVAFRGTVTRVDAGSVWLAVDRWYRGEPVGVAQVRLAATNQNVAIDGVEFVVGHTYLVSAQEGVVSVCGYSGEATPELQALYDKAFGG